MDIKAKIDELVTKIKNDPAAMDNFQMIPLKLLKVLQALTFPMIRSTP